MYQLHSEYQPTGDQPQAIQKLTEGVERGLRHQVLLGVTGSGKTFTMANIIKNLNRPALIIAHNKTLAAQLASEFRDILFPIMIIISRKPTFRPRTLSLRRILPSTMRLTACVTALLPGFPNAET